MGLVSGRGAIAATTLPALMVPAAGAVLYFHVAEGAVAAVLYVLTKLFTVAWPVTAVAVLLREPVVLRRRDSTRRGAAMAAGLLSGLVVGAALLALHALTPLGDAVRASAPNLRAKIVALGLLEWYVPFAVFLAVIHSWIEEYFWRWFVFGQLSRLVPLPAAYALASVAFAAHHLVVLWAYFPPLLACLAAAGVAAGGVLWCRLFRVHGGLLAPWLSHLVVDAVILAIGARLLA